MQIKNNSNMLAQQQQQQQQSRHQTAKDLTQYTTRMRRNTTIEIEIEIR